MPLRLRRPARRRSWRPHDAAQESLTEIQAKLTELQQARSNARRGDTTALVDLETKTADHASGLTTDAAAAAALASQANALLAQTTDLATLANQHAIDAAALEGLIDGSITDATAVNPVDPIKASLVANLAAAKAKATIVTSVASQIAQRVDAVRDAAQAIRDQLGALASAIHARVDEAVDIGDGLRQEVRSALRDLASRLGSVGDRAAALSTRLDALQGSGLAPADTGRTGPRAAVSAKKASAQASLQAALGAVEAKLAEANQSYAELLTQAQIALQHQLPGGNATGATAQDGFFLYLIPGTG